MYDRVLIYSIWNWNKKQKKIIYNPSLRNENHVKQIQEW